MNKGKTWRRLAAWVLTVSMILGSNSFAVLAEEMTEPQSTAGEPAPAAEEPAPIVEEPATVVETETTEAPAETEPAVSEEAETEASSSEDETQAVSESTAAGESEGSYEEIPAMDAEEEFLVGDELLVIDEAATLSTDLLSADGDGEEEQPDYEIWMEDLRGDGYTWVYADENMTVSLNTQNLEELENGYEIEWQAVWVDEEKNETLDPQDDYYTVNEDHSITLHGAKLAELIKETKDWTSIDLHAAIMVDGEGVSGVGTGVNVRRVSYEYGFPIGDDTYLPENELWIRKTFNCFVQNGANPYGADLAAEFTDITVENDAGTPDAVTGPMDEENGWSLYLNEAGHATITLQYKLKDTDMETQTYSFNVWVTEDKWYVDLEPGKSTDRMLPGDTYDLTANVRREYYEDGDVYEGDAREGLITWSAGEGAEYVTLEPDENNSAVLHVKAKEDVDGWQDVSIICTVSKDGAEVASSEYRLSISPVYTAVELGEDLQTLRELNMGATADVTPTLYEYSSAGGQEVSGPVRYYWEWDENALEITDKDGNTLTEQDPYGEAPFTVRRLGNWETNARLIAKVRDEQDEEENWYESARLNLYFEEKNYDIRTEEERNWVFSDEDLTVSLFTENLEESLDDYTIEWKMGRWVQDGEEWRFDEFLTADGYYTVNTDNSIILHGAKLAGLSDEQRDGLQVMAEAKNNDVVLSEAYMDIEIREPSWD